MLAKTYSIACIRISAQNMQSICLKRRLGAKKR